MAKTESRNKNIQKKWLRYFENIEKENNTIRILLEYFKKLEIDMHKAESNKNRRSDFDNFRDFRQANEQNDNDDIGGTNSLPEPEFMNFDSSWDSQKQDEEMKSILPDDVRNINKKELRKYLSETTKKIDEFQKKLNESEIFASSELRQKIRHFNELKLKLKQLREETQKIKLEINKINKNRISSLCIGNFKGFAEENDKKDNTVKISPITLIYGPNSYGKSSILQSLLLLHQTVREGEDFHNVNLLPIGNLVKLGTFDDFINKKDTEKELKIELTLPYNHYFDDSKDDTEQNTSVLTELSFCYHFRQDNKKQAKRDKKLTNLSKIDIYARQYDYTNVKRPIKSRKKLLYTFEQNTDNTYEIKRHLEDDISIDEFLLKNEETKQIFEKISFFRLEEFLPGAPFEQVEKIIKNLVYVSSFRIPPERYYTPENNTRIYVGKNGEHTAEILSYDEEVDKDVNRWLYTLAGYELSSSKGSNNKIKSINLDDKSTSINELNLIDLGSGIAQVLPIITQAFKSENDMILIEEPEIHLHPRAQAELGEMFADAIKKPRNNTFIIETHSENLLLRLGKLIRKGLLSKDDVSIIYVHKDETGSHCIPLILDNDGDIENIREVPGGFFDEGFDELFLS